MSKVEQIEAEIGKLTPAEQQQIRDWLDDMIEDQLEFTPGFEAKIQQSERDREAGLSGRIRRPEDPV